MAGVKLLDLLPGGENPVLLQGSMEVRITGIAESAGSARPGNVFFCIKGINRDGHDFAAEAARRGASALVVERAIKAPAGVTVIKVRGTRRAMLFAVDRFYAAAKKKVKIIAITGTKGKTTVSYLIDALLKQKFGRDNAVIGTIGYRIGKKTYPPDNTTPSNIRIHKLIAEAAARGIRWVIIETSSHALDQGRVDNINFDAAVVTNITRDHFDYHKTYANYLRAKLKITRRLKKNAVFAMNLDSNGCREMLDAAGARTGRIVTYSFRKKADFRPVDYSLDVKGMDFTLDIKGVKADFRSHLVGEHNIYNIMSALAVTSGIVGIKDARRAVEKFETVKGRLDRAYSGQYDVIVDYAHTPGSLEQILKTLNTLKKGRLITVFGAGGDRDRGKRPIMGRIAERASDVVIVTSDNPRFEDPKAIIRDIMAGVAEKNRVIVEPDRRAAIAAAVKLAKKDDIILLAGKGHERYQDIKGVKRDFDDAKVSLELIKKEARTGRKTLGSLISGVRGLKLLRGDPDTEIKGIEDRSSKVKKGYLFIAVKGFAHDGHDFIGEAVRRGAAAVMVQDKKRARKIKAAVIAARDSREAMFAVTDAFYGSEKDRIKIIGITGTNGKTTVMYMIDSVLRAANNRPNATVGTIEYRIGGKKYGAINTTPSNIILHRLIEEAVRKKLKYLIMEVSSHALDQGRLKNIELDTAVVTNVTRDHFDYHGDFKKYLAAKLKIAGAVKPGGRLAVNIDDRNARKFIQAARARGLKVVTYSLKKKSADVKAESYKLDMRGTDAVLRIRGGRKKIRINMPGVHNVYNVLSAAAAVMNEARLSSVKRGIESLPGVNGRTQLVYDRDFCVMVDYAHTPDALTAVLKAVNAVKKNIVITVFGAPGNRDRGKRPMMGAVVEKLSGRMIVTSDNTENEEPMDIINEIMKGVKNKNRVIVEPDRKKAIETAVKMAGRGDVVLIAGKGHEKYQDIGGRKLPFEDRAAALAAIKRFKCS
jgi:UDP-N-acetylmuramoyl-L-alanyl-D-glutamate--2,6-diaminopimelate ligase